MKIARFSHQATTALGVVRDDLIFDLSPEGVPPDLVSVLARGDDAVTELAKVAASATRSIPLTDVRLESPIQRPPKFLGIGMNSPDHAAELADAGPDPRLADLRERIAASRRAYPEKRFPMVFNKQSTCVTGPRDPIYAPSGADELDYEGEVAIVVARRCRRVRPADALGALVGCTVTNDVSVREWQMDTPTATLGKSYDTHGPLGPWIVTLDELGDPQDLHLQTWVNDELRQDGSTADHTLTIPEIVSALSQVFTLEAGDVIATGTPAGVGLISGRYLKVGDRVRVSVEGIGELDNPVIADPFDDTWAD